MKITLVTVGKIKEKILYGCHCGVREAPEPVL